MLIHGGMDLKGQLRLPHKESVTSWPCGGKDASPSSSLLLQGKRGREHYQAAARKEKPVAGSGRFGAT
ncbi:hypothetical protein E2C01_088966 [Portunus trituberculatus]|uniref:Uncharacterized protein n=1 Tax=Portunus trituberculatus TaxID=210409 RepID=A0A5B7J7K4_PORTR|nr:hypothetical protein [Portunus trituberculatus]